MTTISNNDIAHAIYLELKGENVEEQSLVSSKIIQFLVRRRLLSKSPEILSRLDKMINDEEGRIVIKVSSKEPLNEGVKKKLSETLSKRYLGKSVILVENIDERLLGGFKIEVNDEVIDLTINNKIGKLQEYLMERI